MDRADLERFWCGLEAYISLRSEATFKSLNTLLNQLLAFLSVERGTESAALALIKLQTESAIQFIKHLKGMTGHRNRATGQREPLADSTLKLKLGLCRQIYRHLCACGYRDDNPFEADSMPKFSSKATKQQTRAIPWAKVPDLIQAGKNDRDRAMLAILCASGIRLCELKGLRRCDFIFEAQSVKLVLVKTKAGQTQIQHAANWCKLHILRYLQDLDDVDFDTPIFPSCRKKITQVVRQAGRRVGIRDLTPHCLRASAVTRILEISGDIRRAQVFARHSSISATERYDKRRLELLDIASSDLSFNFETPLQKSD